MPRIIAFIPVRGGSSSIPLKNIRLIGGRPLLYWTLDAAVACSQIETIHVCTDSDEIGRVTMEYGSSKVVLAGRSPEVSTDVASTESVMLEFARERTFDYMVLIQATSPLLTGAELEGGIEAFFQREVLPYAPDAWIDETKIKIGYEISFTRHFYKPEPLRTLDEIRADILALEQETDGLLGQILGQGPS